MGLLNAVVTNLLNPFLAPAPNAPEPITPVVWAVLGWVRRNLFNQSPTIKYDPTTTAQTGQTVTGYIGAAPSLLWAFSATALILAPLLIVVAVWMYTLVFAFSGLWFAHYALAALQRLRQPASPVPAPVIDLPV